MHLPLCRSHTIRNQRGLNPPGEKRSLAPGDLGLSSSDPFKFMLGGFPSVSWVVQGFSPPANQLGTAMRF